MGKQKDCLNMPSISNYRCYEHRTRMSQVYSHHFIRKWELHTVSMLQFIVILSVWCTFTLLSIRYWLLFGRKYILVSPVSTISSQN